MNTKKVGRKFDIVAGPSIGSLFDACKYTYDKNVRIPVDFTIAIAYTAPKDSPSSAYIPMSISDIKIVSIEHEDGSGWKLNLRGYCNADLESTGRITTRSPYAFSAYYDARTRKGVIVFRNIS